MHYGLSSKPGMWLGKVEATESDEAWKRRVSYLLTMISTKWDNSSQIFDYQINFESLRILCSMKLSCCVYLILKLFVVVVVVRHCRGRVLPIYEQHSPFQHKDS